MTETRDEIPRINMEQMHRHAAARSSEGAEPAASYDDGRPAGWTYQHSDGAGWQTHVVLNPAAPIPSKNAPRQHQGDTAIRAVRPFYYLSPQPQGGGEVWTLPHLRMAHEAMAEMAQLIHDEGSAELGDSHELETMDRARIAVAEALSVALKAPVEGELTFDYLKALPGGGLDDSTFEAIETALDKAGAPCRADGDTGKWLTLPERIAALSTPPPRVSVEEIESCLMSLANTSTGLSELKRDHEDDEIWIPADEAFKAMETAADILDRIRLARLSPAQEGEGR